MSVPFNASGVAFCMLLGYSVLTHSLTHSFTWLFKKLHNSYKFQNA